MSSEDQSMVALRLIVKCYVENQVIINRRCWMNKQKKYSWMFSFIHFYIRSISLSFIHFYIRSISLPPSLYISCRSPNVELIARLGSYRVNYTKTCCKQLSNVELIERSWSDRVLNMLQNSCRTWSSIGGSMDLYLYLFFSPWRSKIKMVSNVL